MDIPVGKRGPIVQHKGRDPERSSFASLHRHHAFSQCFIRAGSRSTAFARIGKSVLGRFKVSLSFSGCIHFKYVACKG